MRRGREYGRREEEKKWIRGEKKSEENIEGKNIGEEKQRRDERGK
jgi:hypothetical protein